MSENLRFWQSGTSSYGLPATWLKSCGLLALLLVVPSIVSAQQPVATPMHRIVWDQADASGLSFEISVDGSAAAPVLGSTCASGICNGALPVSLQAGVRVLRLRSYRVTDGVRQESAFSPDFTIRYVTNPSAPGNLRLEAPAAQQASVSGIVGEPYDFNGLRVVAVSLPWFGSQVFVGAPSLKSADYTVQAGDYAAVAFWRP
jgi:hypothetical protein